MLLTLFLQEQKELVITYTKIVVLFFHISTFPNFHIYQLPITNNKKIEIRAGLYHTCSPIYTQCNPSKNKSQT